MNETVGEWVVWVCINQWPKREHQIKTELRHRMNLLELLLCCSNCTPLIKYGEHRQPLRFPLFTHTHTHAHTSMFLSHEVLVCYQSDFLSQIFISNQSSWLNLKSEPSSINHITCLTPIMPAPISHRNETPPCLCVCVCLPHGLHAHICVCLCTCVSWNWKMDVDRAVIWSMSFWDR